MVRSEIRRSIVAATTSVWFILVFALTLRVTFAWSRQRQLPDHILSSIPFLYEPGNIAYSLATGHGFSSPLRGDTGPTAWSSPVYPLLIAGIFRIFGTFNLHAFFAAVALNILCSTLTCIPLYFASRRSGGASLASTATWLWAVFPNAIIIPFEWIWDSSLSSLLVATILWATLALAQSGRLRNSCAYGLLWGLTLMTNASLVSLLPLLLAWLGYSAYRHKQPGWLARPALAAFIAVLCCVPWTMRNYVVLHGFVPLRSVLGLQLWLGNNDQYVDTFPGWLHPVNNRAERAEYVRLGELAYMRAKQEQALDWMRTHPSRVAKLSWARFVATWAGTPTPFRDFRRTDALVARAVMLCNVLVTLGALAGTVFLIRARSPYAFPVIVFPVVFPLPFYLMQALLRYRHPIDPILLLLTAVAIKALRPSRKTPVDPQPPLPALEQRCSHVPPSS